MRETTGEVEVVAERENTHEQIHLCLVLPIDLASVAVQGVEPQVSFQTHLREEHLEPRPMLRLDDEVDVFDWPVEARWSRSDNEFDPHSPENLGIYAVLSGFLGEATSKLHGDIHEDESSRYGRSPRCPESRKRTSRPPRC